MEGGEKLERKYAGFWIRVVSNIVDAFILLPILILVDSLLFAVVNPGMSYIEYVVSMDTSWTMFDTYSFIVSLPIGIFYYGYMTAEKQATLGKMVMGLRVIGENGEAISFGRAVGRYFSYTLSSILYIGYIMIAFSQTKQGLHDKICKTYVVYK